LLIGVGIYCSSPKKRKSGELNYLNNQSSNFNDGKGHENNKLRSTLPPKISNTFNGKNNKSKGSLNYNDKSSILSKGSKTNLLQNTKTVNNSKTNLVSKGNNLNNTANLYKTSIGIKS
jgi:hypothetical protein